MDTNTTREERLAAAHAALTEAIAQVATSEDWQNLLRISGSFHRYSPNNQLLLAAQGAEGLVAAFNTWKQVPAIDGRLCQIRKGEKALRVYAPIRNARREIDEDTGEEVVEELGVGFKLVPVFHQGQLVAPPDFPVQPKLLEGEDPPFAIWAAVSEQIADAGYSVRRGPLQGVDGPKGVTSFTERTVTVRDDLAPAQALKTQIHELGHVLMHFAEIREPGMARDRMEVEAESVAYIVCDILGVDAGTYSIPYVANWAGADVELVQVTAQKVLSTARQIVVGLEAELGIDLRPNPFLGLGRPAVYAEFAPMATPGVLVGAGSTDQIIHDHLASGPVDWSRLAVSIPALEQDRARTIGNDPKARAIALAEAGASAEVNARFLRASGLDDRAIVSTLTVAVRDELGELSTLYARGDAIRATREPRAIRPLVEGMVADLLVSAGRHPAAVRFLAESSGQPASVINLVEERLRRSGTARAATDRRSSRGLSLIDEWTVGDEPSRTTPVLSGIERMPDPPAPPAA